MKHSDLLKAIQEETSLPAEKVQAMSAHLVAMVSDCLSAGDSLSVQSFGSFEVRKKEERLSVSPSTGKRYMVPPKQVPVFRPSSILKEKIKKR